MFVIGDRHEGAATAACGASAATIASASLLARMPRTMCIGPWSASECGERGRQRPALCAPSTQVCAAPMRAWREPLASAPALTEAVRSGTTLGADRRAHPGPGASARRGWRCGSDDRPGSDGTEASGRVAQSRPSRQEPRHRARRRLRWIAASASAACASATSGTSGLGDAGLLGGDSDEVDARGTAGGRGRGWRCPPTNGRSITLVASSRPPSPTSTMQASAGVRAKARKATAVVTSKKLGSMSSLASRTSASKAARDRPRSACRRCGCAR